MRPALQKLLARPSSLELLRCLLGKPQEFCTTAPKSPMYLRPRSFCRRYSSAAVAILEKTGSDSPDVHNSDSKHPTLISPTTSDLAPLVRNNGSGIRGSKQSSSTLNLGPWEESLWIRYDIEYESNLEAEGPKLLDKEEYKADLRLWACLFDYRRRIHGAAGVAMFWDAAKRGDFQIPMRGALGTLFWEEFTALGLRNDHVLSEVCELADKMLELTNMRWRKLYHRVVQHMLVHGRGNEAISWHDRLFEHHPPGPKAFAEMARQVVHKRGDLKALKEVYKKNKHRNAYGKVVPLLCQQEDFSSALEWHFIFIKNGDLPVTSKIVEPLVHFLAIYDRQDAVRVTRSLVAAGVPFASRISSTLEDTLKDKAMTSSETTNLIHGERHNIQPKAYSDDLGARWFATRWVSLDVAMTAISSLGVSEIGPLSLQAIALRERDARGITSCINRLKALNISIGNSTFSRAVEEFARTENQAFLDCLLESDQHPHELEDPKLQEQLLNSYARSQDLLRHGMTLAVRVIGSKDPERESKNIMLRSYAQMGDTPTLLASLEKMRMEGSFVTPITIATILRAILRPRQPGHRPMTSTTEQADDLKMAIGILKGIMESGSFVSPTAWREIIRRLGMEGRQKDLEDLCVFLASWYGPANRTLSLDPATQKRVRQYRVPAQVTTSHASHPLKVLFPPSLQEAIVEWGFIHALSSPHQEPESKGLICEVKLPPLVTSGISLLQRLRKYGVHIQRDSVEKAIINRLVTYYGPGQSSKGYNRRARENNVLSLEEMAAQIDAALGMQMFSVLNLQQVIEKHSRIKRERYALKHGRQ